MGKFAVGVAGDVPEFLCPSYLPQGFLHPQITLGFADGAAKKKKRC